MNLLDHLNNQPQNHKTNLYVQYWIGINFDEFQEKYDKSQMDTWIDVINNNTVVFDRKLFHQEEYYRSWYAKYIYDLLLSKTNNKNIFAKLVWEYIKISLDISRRQAKIFDILSNSLLDDTDKNENIIWKSKLEKIIEDKTKEWIQYIISYVWGHEWRYFDIDTIGQVVQWIYQSVSFALWDDIYNDVQIQNALEIFTLKEFCRYIKLDTVIDDKVYISFNPIFDHNNYNEVLKLINK